MLKSQNRIVNYILRMIGEDGINNIDQYVESAFNKQYAAFNSEEQLAIFNEYISNFYSNNSASDIDHIRYYTGIAFRNINAVLRGNWNYDQNGKLTDEKKYEYLDLAQDLSKSLNNIKINLPCDIKTYRGVSLGSFKDYNITSIDELKNMVGQYFYDSGFTSTSLLRDRSFFDRDLEWNEKCDIEIEYYISKECNDGLPLIRDELSYTKGQSEFLINKGSLTKIVDVKINNDGKAYIKAVLIPQKIWNMSYENRQEKTK